MRMLVRTLVSGFVLDSGLSALQSLLKKRVCPGDRTTHTLPNPSAPCSRTLAQLFRSMVPKGSEPFGGLSRVLTVFAGFEVREVIKLHSQHVLTSASSVDSVFGLDQEQHRPWRTQIDPFSFSIW